MDILTEEVYDDTKTYCFRILHLTTKSSLNVTKNDTKESIKETKLHGLKRYEDNFKDIIDTDNNLKEILKISIKQVLTTNGNYSSADEETERILTDLIIELVELKEDDKARLDLIDTVLLDDNYDSLLKDSLYRNDEIVGNAELNTLREKLQYWLEKRVNKIYYYDDLLEEKQSEKVTDTKMYMYLADYLTKQGVILRRNNHYIYKVKGNGYEEVTIDDLIDFINLDLGASNIISDKDLEKAIGFIGKRVEPKHNIIRFNNCLYDIKNHIPYNPTEPIFTLIDLDYDYNPEAEQDHMLNFLYSSLAKYDLFGNYLEEETERTIKGLLEFIGYSLTAGNTEPLLLAITGISGGGKSVLNHLLVKIHKLSNVSDVKLEDIEYGGFKLSQFAHSVLNICRDADNTVIKSNGRIKQITGGDDLQIEEKYKNPYTLSKDETPKIICIANNPPVFENMEDAMVERLGIIEFNVKFRGTEREDKNILDKLTKKNEIEWLIYNSLQAYREMKINNKSFSFRVNKEDTIHLLEKHSKPLNYLIKELINGFDYESLNYDKLGSNNDYVLTSTLNNLCLLLAEKEGIEAPKNKNGKISPKKLIETIKYEFDLEEEIIDDYGNIHRFNTMTKRVEGKSVRIYPNLIKSELYKQLEKELIND